MSASSSYCVVRSLNSSPTIGQSNCRFGPSQYPPMIGTMNEKTFLVASSCLSSASARCGCRHKDAAVGGRFPARPAPGPNGPRH